MPDIFESGIPVEINIGSKKEPRWIDGYTFISIDGPDAVLYVSDIKHTLFGATIRFPMDHVRKDNGTK